MPFSIDNATSTFNWASGVGTFTFSSEHSGCAGSLAVGSTYPPANTSDFDGLIPSAIIPGASVVANITKVQDFNGNVSISTCDDSTVSGASGSAPQVGQVFVIQGQCVMITIAFDSIKCSKNSLEIQSALIGDFCAQSPNADVCKSYDAKVTVPPALRATQGGGMPIANSNVTTAPSTTAIETKSGAVSTSTHRVVLASLAACVVAMASLS